MNNKVSKSILLFFCFTLLSTISCTPKAQTDELATAEKQAEAASLRPQAKLTQQPPSQLFPITKNGKEGFIDRTGKVFIQPQYDLAFGFSEGLAPISTNSKWGYINQMGKIVIKPQMEEVSIFSEDLAAVKTGSKWGFINPKGQVVIKPVYDEVTLFSEGLAAVKVGKKWGHIDKTGKTAIKMFKSYPMLKKKPYWGNHFWARGYFVNTVGINEDMIRRYVKYQEEEERKEESNQREFDFDL